MTVVIEVCLAVSWTDQQFMYKPNTLQISLFRYGYGNIINESVT